MKSDEKVVLTPELIDLLATILANVDFAQPETPISTPVWQGTESDFPNSDSSPFKSKLAPEKSETYVIKGSGQTNGIRKVFSSEQAENQCSRRYSISQCGQSSPPYNGSPNTNQSMMLHCATTLMIKNIPNRVSREELLYRIQSEMPSGSFNFLYMPIDFNNRLNFGYAFINMTNDMYIDLFNLSFNKKRIFDGKLLDIVIARVQGFTANINRLISSPVLSTADDESLPLIFHGDIQIPFRKLMNLNRASALYAAAATASGGGLGEGYGGGYVGGKPSIDELISIVLEEETTSSSPPY